MIKVPERFGVYDTYLKIEKKKRVVYTGPLWKSVWLFLRKMRIDLPQDPAILLLGIYPKDASSYCRDTCSASPLLLYS